MFNMFDTISIVCFLVAAACLIYTGIVFFDDAERTNSRLSEVSSYIMIAGGLYGLYIAFDLIQACISINTLL